jgi:hypothetical protein
MSPNLREARMLDSFVFGDEQVQNVLEHFREV